MEGWLVWQQVLPRLLSWSAPWSVRVSILFLFLFDQSSPVAVRGTPRELYHYPSPVRGLRRSISRRLI